MDMPKTGLQSSEKGFRQRYVNTSDLKRYECILRISATFHFLQCLTFQMNFILAPLLQGGHNFFFFPPNFIEIKLTYKSCKFKVNNKGI